MKAQKLVSKIWTRTVRAFHWWRGEMYSTLPSGMVAALTRNSSRIVIHFSDRNFRVQVVSAQMAVLSEAPSPIEKKNGLSLGWPPTLHAFAFGHLVDLRVPESCMLRQTITLPRAAMENLQGAIAFGLPTWSPFTRDEVYVATRVAASDAQRITVDLRYAVRDHLHSLIQQAHDAGLAPDRLIFDQAGDWATIINPEKGRRIIGRRRIDAGLACVAGFLVVALAASVLWQQSKELAAYEHAVREELAALKKAEGERQTREALAMSYMTVARRRDARPRMTEVVAAIGEKLPPSTALASIEINSDGGKMDVIGSPGSNLLDILRDVAVISNPRADNPIPNQPQSISFGILGATP
ncbi:hypothetical protein [Microvirga terricola]|uniref:General secretion pathway protein L n=1 Tax=Microvirga terricola TaxID=2719797 RepID=A0ABX0VF20_9HYPH|nr:hypothetical protein [Microvirga terricola]NIX78437.1 hypothetical protein [Microvirga terricola]